MIIELLTKFIYMLRIQMQQNINILLKHEKNDPKNLKDAKAFIEYANGMQNVYKNNEEYSPSRKYNVLMVFDYMIAKLISNKKSNSN